MSEAEKGEITVMCNFKKIVVTIYSPCQKRILNTFVFKVHGMGFYQNKTFILYIKQIILNV